MHKLDPKLAQNLEKYSKKAEKERNEYYNPPFQPKLFLTGIIGIAFLVAGYFSIIAKYNIEGTIFIAIAIVLLTIMMIFGKGHATVY